MPGGIDRVVLKAFAARLRGGLRESDVERRVRQQFSPRLIDLGEGRKLQATFSAGIGDASGAGR